MGYYDTDVIFTPWRNNDIITSCHAVLWIRGRPVAEIARLVTQLSLSGNMIKQKTSKFVLITEQKTYMSFKDESK